MKADKCNGSLEYNAFSNNCEHFSTWCKRDKRTSSQIQYLKFWILKRLPACLVRLIADVCVEIKISLPQSVGKGIVIGALKCLVNAIGMVLEFGFIAIELAILQKKSENNEITEESFYEAVKKQLLFGYIFSLFFVIGHMMIPIPIVGCLVGAILGSAVAFMANCIVFARTSLWSHLKTIIKRVLCSVYRQPSLLSRFKFAIKRFWDLAIK